jgi:hydrogenase nickel incorporation protein HypA/HybF
MVTGRWTAVLARVLDAFMHELGIVESAMETVLQHAMARDAMRVDRVVMRIGALAGVEPEALRFAFDVVTRGTLAEGAVLEIEAVVALSYCADCQEDFAAAGHVFFVCPKCGALSGELRQGRELELARIELTPTPCVSNAAVTTPSLSA